MVPVKVSIDRETLDLDLDAIAAAITPRTRIVIVNSPNNPTGQHLPARHPRAPRGHPRRGVGAERPAHLPDLRRGLQPHRLRRRALPQSRGVLSVELPRLQLRQDAAVAGRAHRLPRGAADDARPRGVPRCDRDACRSRADGSSPTPSMQYALPKLETLAFDIPLFQRKRDVMVAAMRDIGYHVSVPEGTFYLFPESPLADDVAFTRELDRQGVLVLPGPDVRDARILPDLAHRDDGDDRGWPAAVRGGVPRRRRARPLTRASPCG